MLKKRGMVAFFVTCFFLGSIVTGCRGEKETVLQKEKVTRMLSHTSYSTTREFYAAYNEWFREYWKKKKKEDVEVQMSHKASGLLVENWKKNGETDIISLAHWKDMDTLQEEKVVSANWMKAMKEESAPYTSPIVFLVRKDGKKEIDDWGDLTNPDVEVLTANPETSGGGVWNFFGAWSYGKKISNEDEHALQTFLQRFYDNVLILYEDSREGVTRFVEYSQGDVLITWESEAYLAKEAYPDDFEMIVPSTTIMARPVIALENTSQNGENKEVSQAYIEQLYSKEVQRMLGEYYFRPVDKEIIKEYEHIFDQKATYLEIEDMGEWEEIWEECFGEDGLWKKIAPKEG